jgi:hypothetical protein
MEDENVLPWLLPHPFRFHKGITLEDEEIKKMKEKE